MAGAAEAEASANFECGKDRGPQTLPAVDALFEEQLRVFVFLERIHLGQPWTVHLQSRTIPAFERICHRSQSMR